MQTTVTNAGQFVVANDEEVARKSRQRATSSNSVACALGSSDPTKGITLGYTSWDAQKNGTMGRQIVINPVSHSISFVWTHHDVSQSVDGRGVRWESFIPEFGLFSDGVGGIDVLCCPVPPERSGYPTMALDGSGFVHIGLHYNGNYPTKPIFHQGDSASTSPSHC